MKKQLLLYACPWYVFLFCFWMFSGQPFGRPDLGDIGFHLQRSMNPFCFVQGSCSYYAPLFSFIVAALNQIFSLEAAFTIAEALILFVLLPYAFYRLSKTFWGEEGSAKATVFLALFGSSFSIISVVAGIIPQALNTVFLALGLEAMIRDQKNPSHRNAWMIALWGILSVLSHQKGWYLYVFVVFVWLIQKEHFKTYTLILAAGLIYSPTLTAYPFQISHLPELALLWLNPVNVYLAYQGRKQGSDKLLDAAIAASVLFSWTDPNYRPLLTASILLSVYGGRGLLEEKNPERYQLTLVFMWTAHLLFCILGVVALMYLGQV
jgi:hypothetical protein